MKNLFQFAIAVILSSLIFSSCVKEEIQIEENQIGYEKGTNSIDVPALKQDPDFIALSTKLAEMSLMTRDIPSAQLFLDNHRGEWTLQDKIEFASYFGYSSHTDLRDDIRFIKDTDQLLTKRYDLDRYNPREVVDAYTDASESIMFPIVIEDDLPNIVIEDDVPSIVTFGLPCSMECFGNWRWNVWQSRLAFGEGVVDCAINLPPMYADGEECAADNVFIFMLNLETDMDNFKNCLEDC